MNSSDSYKQSLDIALAELSNRMAEREELENQRENLDREISRLREGALGLAALCTISRKTLGNRHPELFPDLIDPDTGMTEAIRNVLKGINGYLSPVQVRDRLEGKGFPINNYKNILASIHTVLKRLRDSGQVGESERDGKTVYKYGK